MSYDSSIRSSISKKEAVEDFLVEVKKIIRKKGGTSYGWRFEPRRENMECLSELGFTLKDACGVIMGLSVLNYCTGPIEDQSYKGDLWVFGKVISNREVYIKLKVAAFSTLKIVRIISFHFAKEKLSYPYTNKKGGSNEEGDFRKG